MRENKLQPTSTRSRRLTAAPLLFLLAVWTFATLAPASTAAQTPDSAINIIEVTHDAGGPMFVTFEAATADITSLELLVDGAPAEFELTSSMGTPPSIIFVVENSASMTAAQRAQFQTAASALLAAVDSATPTAIVAIGDGAETTLPFTQDHATVATTLAGLPVGGTAALYSGVEVAANLADDADGEVLIVVASYGWNWGSASTTTREASLAAIESSGAAVYVQSMVFFGEDVAYLTGIASDQTIHNLAVLAALPNAASLLEGNAVTQHTIEVDSSYMQLGEHQLTLTLGGESDSISVTDNGPLLTVSASNTPEAGNPLTYEITTNEELAATALVATVAGETVPVAASGTIELDPWQFAPGTASLEVSAMLGDTLISAATTELSIPNLEPVLTTEPSADGVLVVSVQAQPGVVTQLVASVDGENVASSESTTIEVALPSTGTLTIDAVGTAGTTLSSTAVTVEPTALPTLTTEPAPDSPPYELAAGGLLAALALVAIAGIRRRKRTTSLRVVEALAHPESDQRTEALSAAPHKRVELRPALGECDVVLSRQGHEEERLPVGRGAVSIGASPLCDITLDGRDTRFVHAVIGLDGPLLRIHRFGPITIDGRPMKDDTVTLEVGTSLTIDGATLTVVTEGEQPKRRLGDGIVAA